MTTTLPPYLNGDNQVVATEKVATRSRGIVLALARIGGDDGYAFENWATVYRNLPEWVRQFGPDTASGLSSAALELVRAGAIHIDNPPYKGTRKDPSRPAVMRLLPSGSDWLDAGPAARLLNDLRPRPSTLDLMTLAANAPPIPVPPAPPTADEVALALLERVVNAGDRIAAAERRSAEAHELVEATDAELREKDRRIAELEQQVKDILALHPNSGKASAAVLAAIGQVGGATSSGKSAGTTDPS